MSHFLFLELSDEMELLVHFLYCQTVYYNDLKSGTKFYYHSFNTYKMMAQNTVNFVPSVTEKKCYIFTEIFSLFLYIIQMDVFV